MTRTDQDVAGIWRGGSALADAADPPYDAEALRKRVARCSVASVRIDPRPADSGLKIDSDTARQLRAERLN